MHSDKFSAVSQTVVHKLLEQLGIIEVDGWEDQAIVVPPGDDAEQPRIYLFTLPSFERTWPYLVTGCCCCRPR